MKAIVLHETGSVEKFKVENVPKPVLNSGEILVRNQFTGINYIDIYQRTGLYPISLPAILGREGVGIVEDVGPGVPANLFKPGDRVAYLSPATYAEYTAVSAQLAIPISSPSLSGEVAICLMLQGMTAAYLTHDSYPVRPGDWVLVPAAAGGTGSLICQMAAIRGGRVIALVGSEEKAHQVQAILPNSATSTSNGQAHHIINYRKNKDWDREVLKITGGNGVNVAYDGVGAETYRSCLASMAKRGTYILFGNASGKSTDMDAFDLTSKCLKFMRPALFSYVETREEFLNLSGLVMKLYEEGKLQVHIHKVYPLEEVAQAQDDMEHRRTTGKLVIKID